MVNFTYGLSQFKLNGGNQLSSHIVISKGTRQGGLSSPFLFNLFYKDLIDMLSAFSGGITIGAMSYNVFLLCG